MKKLLLLLIFICNTSHAAEYYISQSTGDNASADPTNISTPCQTWVGCTNKNFEGANVLSPGDNIYFMRGDIWEGAGAVIEVASNGEDGNPITLDAYGSGTRPQFSMSTVVTGFEVSSGAIYSIGSQTQDYIRSVTTNDTQALGEYDDGDATQLPAGTFQHNSSTDVLYVHMWDSGDPDDQMVRIGTGDYGNSFRGMVRTDDGSTYGNYIHFKNIQVIGSNTMGISISGSNCRIENSWVMGAGKDGILSVGYAPGGESGDGLRIYDTEVSYSPAWGDGFGQGITIGAFDNWVVRANIHDNFMAGIDFLDYGTDTDVYESGIIFSTIHNNGIYNNSGSFDANLYVDGANRIFIFGNVITDAGQNGYPGNDRANISIGSEHPDTEVTDEIYVINNLMNNGVWRNIETNNQGDPANVNLVYIINNTAINDLSDSFSMTYGFSDLLEEGSVIMRNNIWVTGNGTNNLLNLYASTTGYEDSNYNLIWNENTSSHIIRLSDESTRYTLSGWQGASLDEDNSIYDNPDFVTLTNDKDTMDVHLATDSPGVDTGLQNAYSVPSWVPADILAEDGFDGLVRGTTRADGQLDNVETSIDMGYHYFVAGADSTAKFTIGGISMSGVSF
jgi:hypothetical protein